MHLIDRTTHWEIILKQNYTLDLKNTQNTNACQHFGVEFSFFYMLIPYSRFSRIDQTDLEPFFGTRLFTIYFSPTTRGLLTIGWFSHLDRTCLLYMSLQRVWVYFSVSHAQVQIVFFCNGRCPIMDGRTRAEGKKLDLWFKVD